MIDDRAVVASSAKLAANVSVGPFAIIGENVEIGEGTWIGPHTIVKGPTRIGRDNKIFQFSSIGEDPQDKKYCGESTWLEIGDRNVIREFCTVNRGTAQDSGVTRIGDDNWIMAYVHIAHDCIVGDHTVFANNASLAGHVQINSYAILGGYTLVYQFCRVGSYSLCAFASGIHRDVPPYFIADGYRAEPRGINIEGLRRNGFTPDEINAIRRAYKLLYTSDLKLDEAIARIRTLAKQQSRLNLLLDFISSGKRSIIR